MKYTVKMRCDGGVEEFTTVKAATLEEAREKAEKRTREWIRGGDWGDSGASVPAWYTVVGDDYEEGITVDIDPDEDALMESSDLDSDCDHHWISTVEIDGGCKENPGVFGGSGTAISCHAHCAECGARRIHRYTGSQRNPGEHDTVEFLPGPANWTPEEE